MMSPDNKMLNVFETFIFNINFRFFFTYVCVVDIVYINIIVKLIS